MQVGGVIAFTGFVITALVMFQITMTKERVTWPGWLLPAAAVIPAAIWLGVTVHAEGPLGLLAAPNPASYVDRDVLADVFANVSADLGPPPPRRSPHALAAFDQTLPKGESR
jgi:hypothetical protein